VPPSLRHLRFLIVAHSGRSANRSFAPPQHLQPLQRSNDSVMFNDWNGASAEPHSETRRTIAGLERLEQMF